MSFETFGDDGQMSKLELESLLKELKLGSDFDPYKVHQLPVKDGQGHSVRISTDVAEPVRVMLDQCTGNGRRFPNRAVAMRQALYYLLMVEHRLAADDIALKQLLDPGIAWMHQQEVAIELTMVRDTVRGYSDLLKKGVSGPLKKEIEIALRGVRNICVERGMNKERRRINNLLEGDYDDDEE
jgi:hypothetical protein